MPRRPSAITTLAALLCFATTAGPQAVGRLLTGVVVAAASQAPLAAHLGFAPTELPVTIPRDSAPTRLRVELAEVQVRLATVQVLADAPCMAPGAPDPVEEREFAVIFQQLEQNVQQYRLLADSFPYAYHEERTNYSVRGAGVIESIHHETVLLRSDRPGEVRTPDGSAVRIDRGFLRADPRRGDQKP